MHKSTTKKQLYYFHFEINLNINKNRLYEMYASQHLYESRFDSHSYLSKIVDGRNWNLALDMARWFPNSSIHCHFLCSFSKCRLVHCSLYKLL